MRSKHRERGPQSCAQAFTGIVDALRAATEIAMEERGGSSDGLLMQAAREHSETEAGELNQPRSFCVDSLQKFGFCSHDHLGRGRWRGRTQIRHKIRDGDVGFMSDGRHDRNRRISRWLARQLLR